MRRATFGVEGAEPCVWALISRMSRCARRDTRPEREAVVEALVRTRTNISQASPGREAPIPLSVH